MSIASDAEDMKRTRAREAAIRQRLDQLEAPTENGKENGIDPIDQIREAHGTALAPSVRRRQPKPWEDANGRQFRPLSRKELSEMDADRVGKEAVENYAKYCDLVQADLDLGAAEEAARQKRQAREIRTGMRPLPSKRETMSLEEAVRSGMPGCGPGIYGGPDRTEFEPDNGWNNRRRYDTFGGGL